jgi:hypothetical protein
MDLPAEIVRRETRLKALAAAKAVIEERTQERFDREQANKKSGRPKGTRVKNPRVGSLSHHNPALKIKTRLI